jgi:hypothetical protein
VIEVRSLDSGQVELKIEDGRTFNFDRVLVATNIKDAPSFLPLEKNELFHKIEKKVKTIRYLVTVFKTTQLFSHRTIFFYSHMNAKLINRTQGILQFVKDPHLFIAYQILDDKISWQEAQVILENDLRDQLGVTEMWVRLQKEWSYFPHIPVENLNNDILGDIRKLQGQGGIYFVGSSWSSENVENAAEHAKFVCDNYFP